MCTFWGNILLRSIINLYFYTSDFRHYNSEMLTTKDETTPDPDRSGEKDVIESRDAPTVFQQENSDDSDDQEESNQGYQIITQEDEEGEDQDDEAEPEPSQRESELADLVRAAQADPENLTEATREMMDRAR